jgi:hypothetical protein
MDLAPEAEPTWQGQPCWRLMGSLIGSKAVSQALLRDTIYFFSRRIYLVVL